MANGQPTLLVPTDAPKFPSEEEGILAFWRKIKAFEKSNELSKGKPEYTFYDGPPFATGLPHYGHILAGTIKDVVTRYYYQSGYHVPRRFGWDCHGLPVEYEIDKKLGLQGRPDVLKMGIDKYNEECRGIVQRYTGEWREVVERFGRWIDFDNDYKTMDRSFMESVWWVFKSLYDKGNVYRAFRVMPYSTACNTPLSNFEVALNYKEVADPSIVVKMKSKTTNEFFLIWTTTPWTLPSNLAVAVHPDLKYLRVKDKQTGETWVVGKDRFDWVLSVTKRKKEDMTVTEECDGKKLAGLTYEPLFPYFEKTHPFKQNCWKILLAEYVTAENGTCMVHQAPAFGEDDYNVCLKNKIFDRGGDGLVCPVDDNGMFTAVVKDFVGLNVKEADDGIKKYLKQKGSLLVNNSEVHNYPFCWRSDTPLIYRATPSWFVKVEEIRDKLIAANKKSYWVPAHVQEKRFHNWLRDARDWCISRSRYWGTPIPLWVSDDLEEIVCIGSVAELEEHAGRKIPDIHRHFIDDIKIPSKKGKGMLKRVDEVFDCWFESGAMPYAQQHYPYENKDKFEKSFPANFIAEGLDQTRGWFYTLMVLSTHLFNEPAFKNLIVNGLVLAADGKKMSKRLKNYPDPQDVVSRHGADAVRMYMCNSPVVRAEPLKFNESGVRDVVKEVFLPWYHAYRFLCQEVGRYETDSGKKFVPNKNIIKTSTNVMDQWIYASSQSLIKFVRGEMEAYRLYTVVPKLVAFLESLTNWYVRLNRDRMRGTYSIADAEVSLNTAYDVLLDATILLAPVVPFITDLIYQNLQRALPSKDPRKAESVHFVMLSDHDPAALKPDIELAVENMKRVIQLGRKLREKKNAPQKKPVQSIKIMHASEKFHDGIKMLQSYVKEELNVEEVLFTTDMSAVSVTAVPNFRKLGKRVGKMMKEVKEACEKLTTEQIKEYESKGKIEVCGFEMTGDELEVKRGGGAGDLEGDDDVIVIMDFTMTPELEEKWMGRELVKRVQNLRKAAGLQQGDNVMVFVETEASKKPKPGPTVAATLKNRLDYVEKLLRRKLQPGARQGHEVILGSEEWVTEFGERVCTTVTRDSVIIKEAELKKLGGADSVALSAWLASYDTAELAKMKSLPVRVGEKKYELVAGVHFTLP